MPNIYWYSGLAVICIAAAAISVYIKRKSIKISDIIVFYLFATGITWVGEVVAMIILDGYAYKPGIFMDPWAENLAAHLILNSTMYPAAAVLVAALSLSYAWFLPVAAFFVLSEYLFTRLGLYEPHWWRMYMSVIIVFVFLTISKIWYTKLRNIRYGFSRTAIFYFVAFVIVHLPIPILLITGKQYYNAGLAANVNRSSTLFIIAYQAVECMMLVFFVCVLKKWYWKLVPYIISFAGQSILAGTSILVFQDGWSLAGILFVYAMIYTVFIILDKYTLKPLKL